MSVARVTLDSTERRAVRRSTWGARAMTLLTSTDHKVIANMYFVTAFAFFGFGGLLALAIRAELAWPGLQYLHYETFNQFFTMHGTIMLLMFATPMFAAFANAVMPLQIGAPDVAFPRMNMFSYWLYLFGSVTACSGFLSPEGAAAFGWFAYAPLSDAINSPGIGGDLWIMGLYVMGLSTILGAVNFVTTIVTMRAPGLTMFRMPIFTWNIFVTSLLVLLVFPVLAAGLLVLEADRRLGTHILDPATGGAVLWQHLFWFFGHPEVYIIALPFFGIITEVLPVFSRKPIFGYVGLVAATMAIGALSIAVWAHHMFVTGAVNLPFFSFMTFLIAVPTGVKFFNWIGTMWGGSITFDTPMIWAIGFLTTFLFGGLTGVILASPPLDFHVSDTYFVVAHFHYVVFGTVVFAMFAGFYYWWPKLTGRMLDERWGKVHFWTLFFGFHLTFLVQHWLGIEGMQRRIADYLPQEGFQFLNQVSTAGAFLLGISMLPFFWNVWISRNAPLVETDDPWGWGRSLEWATSCPPPRHNFTSLPRIRSESPAFDLHHPEIHSVDRAEELDALITGSANTSTGEPSSIENPKGSEPMKVEGWMFTAIAIFLAIVSPIYWFMSHEIIGTVALIMAFLLFGMVGVYLFVLARKMDERVEDRKDAEIVEGAGAMGFFPPKSIWPFWVAVTVQLLALGPVFGWWISILAVCLGIWALSGWVFEFYRGDYQH